MATEAEGRATYPNFVGKHAHDAFFTPGDYVAYQRGLGRLDDVPRPDGIILCYQRSLFERVLRSEGLERPERQAWHALVTLPRTGHHVGVVGGFGIGAPAATVMIEHWIALGTTRFLSIGTAGSLQHHCQVGDVVLCERAIRDEGVSHHYLPPGKYAAADVGLTEAFAGALDDRSVAYTRGSSWTIDTPYRETVEEARFYQAEGTLCVEMEAAALFAVGAYRSVSVASAFVISDSLADLVWEPQFHSDVTADALVALYQAAVEALLAASVS